MRDSPPPPFKLFPKYLILLRFIYFLQKMHSLIRHERKSLFSSIGRQRGKKQILATGYRKYRDFHLSVAEKKSCFVKQSWKKIAKFNCPQISSIDHKFGIFFPIGIRKFSLMFFCLPLNQWSSQGYFMGGGRLYSDEVPMW